jgi:hypothetical protein
MWVLRDNDEMKLYVQCNTGWKGGDERSALFRPDRLLCDLAKRINLKFAGILSGCVLVVLDELSKSAAKS